MLNRLFGDYLVTSGLLSTQQLNAILPVSSNLKASVEVISVINKVLTVTQVQEMKGKIDAKTTRFGDACVEEGVLTDDRLDQLLTYQDNEFMKFIQTLVDKELLPFGEIPTQMEKFAAAGQYKDTQMDALIQNDLERIVNIFVPLKNPRLKLLTVLLVKTFQKLIDKDVYLDRAYTAKSMQLNAYAMQAVIGDMYFKLYLTGEKDNLLGVANYFTGSQYPNVNRDALDNISEFINCVNGQFATNVSYEDLDVDMKAPELSDSGKFLNETRLFVIPIHVNGCLIKAVYEVIE